jgi:hypothetical protein
MSDKFLMADRCHCTPVIPKMDELVFFSPIVTQGSLYIYCISPLSLDLLSLILSSHSVH